MNIDIDAQRIPIKVYRSDDRLMVAAPMPGLTAEDIQVEVTEDGRLLLSGRLRGILKGEDEDILADEWNAGPYHREFRVAVAVDGEHANLTYGNGVLVVVLPLAPATTAAPLTLAATGQGRGARVGHTGNPPTFLHDR